MSNETSPVWATLSFGAAAVSIFMTWWQVRLAAAQNHPYVWVDVCGDPEQPGGLLLQIANSGRTVAHLVRVESDDPVLKGLLPVEISALPPGRVWRHALGPGHSFLEENGVTETTTVAVTVHVQKSRTKKLPPLKYELSLGSLIEEFVGVNHLRTIAKSAEQIARLQQQQWLQQQPFPVRDERESH